MSIQNKIYKKFEDKETRTELASEKVELSVVGDIEKAYKKMDKGFKTLVDIQKKALDAFDKHEDGLLKAYSKSLDDQNKLLDKLKANNAILGDARKIIATAEKAAKDLGLPAKSLPGYDTLDSMIERFPKEFDAVLSSVQRIDKAKI